MPDICMCEGGGCSLKETCYRFIARPDEYRQSYFVNPPFQEKDGKHDCGHYWKVKKDDDDENNNL